MIYNSPLLKCWKGFQRSVEKKSHKCFKTKKSNKLTKNQCELKLIKFKIELH